MKPTIAPLFLRVVLAFSFCAAVSAHAAFHTWNVNEIYSNADGSVQFIELREGDGLDGQHLLPGHSIVCTSPEGTRTFTFPSNLPSAATANKFFIIGTSNLASMPGGLKPDYVFTNAVPFLSLTGGTINFAGGFDVVSYTNPPTDGSGAMIRSGGSMIAVPTNQMINFIQATNSLVPLRFLSIVLNGTDVIVSFDTATGTNGTTGPNYTVQVTNVLGGAAWSTLTNVAGNGAIRSITNPISAEPAGFFRLRVP